jgi:hypothetical protein
MHQVTRTLQASLRGGHPIDMTLPVAMDLIVIGVLSLGNLGRA